MKKYIFFSLTILALMCVNASQAAEREKRFAGIGVVVAQIYDQDSPDHRGELVVLGMPTASASAKAGLQPGDVIVSVDGHTTKGIAFADTVRQRLRGEAGSTAVLKVRRIGHDELMEFKITRVKMRG